MSEPMTDEALAEYLGIAGDECWPAALKALGPKRAVYEQMAQVEIELGLWQAGLGPMPKNVLVDTESSTRRRRAWR